MSRIGSLIHGIAWKNHKDPIRYFQGQILYDSECAGIYNYQVGRNWCFDPNNLIVAVKMISDGSADPSVDTSVDPTLNQLGVNGASGYGIDSQTPAIVDQTTIYPYVRLMSGVSDGFIQIPQQGSTVTVAIASWMDPLIIKYNEIQAVNISMINPYTGESYFSIANPDYGFLSVSFNGSSGTSGPGSFIDQAPTSIHSVVSNNMSVVSTSGIGSDGPSIQVNVVGSSGCAILQTPIEYKIGMGSSGFNSTVYLQEPTGVSIGVPAGPNFLVAPSSGKTLGQIQLEIQSNLNAINNNLTTLNTALNTCLGSLTGASFSSPWTAVDSTFISNISTVASNLGTLSSDINNLLG